MEKARVLNKGELKNTLSAVAANAKKKQKNKSIRNTLALPSKLFWPLVPESDSTEIKRLLKELLPAAKIEYKKKLLRWQDINKMGPEKRKAYRKGVKNAQEVPEERKFLLAGHRSVSRAVEGNHASCCILCGSVSTQLMMAGILSACQHNNIPLVVLTGLQDITLGTLGFHTTALAFKKYVAKATDNKFHPVYKQVAELSKRLLSSSSSSSVSSGLQDNNTLENDKSVLENETVVEKMQIDEEYIKIEPASEIKKEKIEISTQPYKYLYLNTDGSRAFVPPREPPQEKIKSWGEQMDFISLSTKNDNVDDTSVQKRKRQYEESEQDFIASDGPRAENYDNGFHTKSENKRKKQNATPRYFPVNIKTVTSNPRKARKPHRQTTFKY